MTRQAACGVVVVLLTVPVFTFGNQERPVQGDISAFRTIRGQVVADDFGVTPLRRVRILLTGDSIVSTPTHTDAEGRFEIAVPGAAAYTLTFTKAGFAAREVQRDASSPSMDLQIRLARGAAVTGRVVDQFGDPRLARVRVRRVGGETGQRVEAREWTVEIDDLGEFRAGSLPAGRYEVTVEPLPPASSGPSVPGGLGRAPTLVQLGTGEETALSFVEDVRPMDPRGVVIGGSRTPTVEDGATIRGRVVDADSRPVGGAFIRLYAGFESARYTDSSADGAFQFTGLPANTYRVNVIKVGASLAVAQREVDVAVRLRQVVDEVTVVVTRPAAVTGTVLDENGEPVEGVTVELLGAPRGGARRLLRRPAAIGRRTDDRGRYRLFPVEAGEHYVAASEEPRSVRGVADGPESSLRIYYPGRLSVADAITVRVVAGQDMPGIDIAYAPAGGARVYGHALDSSGQPLTSPVTLVESVRSGRPTAAPRQARVGQDGAFSFLNVPPGDYVLQGIVRPSAERSSELAITPVGVAGPDVLPVMLRTSSGTTVRARVELEGDASHVRFDSFGVRASPGDLDYDAIGIDAAAAGVQDDGTFELRVQGPMRITPSVVPRGWWLKSAMIGTVDAAEEPYAFGARGDPVHMVVVFSDATAELSGHVRDGRGRPPGHGSFVVAFPTDESRWYTGSRYVAVGRATPDGSFGAVALPPGDYWIVAVDQSDTPPDLGDAEVLRSLVPRAQRVSARERQSLIQGLSLVERTRP